MCGGLLAMSARCVGHSAVDDALPVVLLAVQNPRDRFFGVKPHLWPWAEPQRTLTCAACIEFALRVIASIAVALVSGWHIILMYLCRSST